MTPMFEHYERLTDREAIEGKFAKLTGPAENDYYVEQLSEIPAGTVLQLDFCGEFGCYALADIDGVLHRVKIKITDLHKIELV